MEKQLRRVWEQLQGKKPHMPHFLSQVNIDGLRGLDGLTVKFDYPVSVIAGGNATGKTTVLLAAACAYKVPDAGVRDFVPSTLFPDYRPRHGDRTDHSGAITLDYQYVTSSVQSAMRWKRAKSWNRSYFGRKNAHQPERDVYLRTLSNLTNPSEVRGVLSMSRDVGAPSERPLTAAQISFAQQMLPFRYKEVIDLSSANGKKKLLFASLEHGVQYSELHMAAGERSILRLSQDVAQLHNALLLIDEVEAGLHPWVQQLLMLKLQQLALRKSLQIIVTSHSPVMIESVPLNGRIFLERDDSNRVVVRPPYRDIIQDALYGRATDTFRLLCEDDAAEGILEGVFDHLAPIERIRRTSIRIGRDTGRDEFPSHARALSKFGQLDNVLFLLDGDARNEEIHSKIQRAAGTSVSVHYLPGDGAPEGWVWEKLRKTDLASQTLNVSSSELASNIEKLDAIYDNASDTASNKVKFKLYDLAETLKRRPEEVCRLIARQQAEQPDSDIQPLIADITDAVTRWRSD